MLGLVLGLGLVLVLGLGLGLGLGLASAAPTTEKLSTFAARNRLRSPLAFATALA